MADPHWLGTTSAAFGTGANWSTASAPVDTDTATFNQFASGPIDGSDQSAIELAALYVWSTFIYNFGTNGTPLTIDATLVQIGRESGSATAGTHSGRINLSLPDIASTIEIFGTKTSAGSDSGKEPVRIKTGANANKLYFKGTGKVGIATDSIGDTAQFSEIALLAAGTMNVGVGTTLTKWRQTAGVGNLFGAATTLQQDAGTLYTYGAGAYTTANIGGTAYLQSTGTITALNIAKTGTVDMLKDSRAKTITTVTMYPGATFKWDPNVITITNPIVVVGGNLRDVTLETPRGITVAVVKS